jgi:hypothetical protein
MLCTRRRRVIYPLASDTTAYPLGSDDMEMLRSDFGDVTLPQPQTRTSEDIATVPQSREKWWLFGFCSLAVRVPDVVQDRCASEIRRGLARV